MITFADWVSEKDKAFLLQQSIRVANGLTMTAEKTPSGSWVSWCGQGDLWKPHTVWMKTPTGSTFSTYTR
jgi:hypothetical protein